MSRLTATKWLIVPEASRTGESVASCWNSRPSLRRAVRMPCQAWPPAMTRCTASYRASSPSGMSSANGVWPTVSSRA